MASVAFDTTGTRLLSAGDDKTARLWDLTADPPALVREFKQAPDKLMWAALSPNNRLVASTGRGSFAAIYKADDGELLHRLVGHEQTVFRAIFSPDGRQLATVSTDATVRLWDLGHWRSALRPPPSRRPGAARSALRFRLPLHAHRLLARGAAHPRQARALRPGAFRQVRVPSVFRANGWSRPAPRGVSPRAGRRASSRRRASLRP